MQFLVGRLVILAFVICGASELSAQSETPIPVEKLKASIRPAENAAGPMSIQSRQGNVARIKFPTTSSTPTKPLIVDESPALAKPNNPNIQLSPGDRAANKGPMNSAPVNRAQSIPARPAAPSNNASQVRQATFLDGGQQSHSPQEGDQDQAIFFPESRNDPIFIEPQDKIAPVPFKLQTSSPPSPGPLPMPKEKTILHPPARALVDPRASSRQELISPPAATVESMVDANLPARNPSAPPQPYMPFSQQQMRSMQQVPSPTVSGPQSSQPQSGLLAKEEFEWETFDDRVYDSSSADRCLAGVSTTWGLFYSTGYLGNNSIRDFSINRLGANQNVEASNGFLGGVQLGINHGRNLRADYDLSYRKNDLETQQLVGPLAIPIAPAWQGDITAISGLSNFYWDFADVNVFGIKSYVGAGIGFAYFDLNLNENGVSALNLDAQNDSNLAYQWLIGVNGKASNNLDWFLEYRYFNAGEVHFTPSNRAQFADACPSFDYISNSVLAGLKYKF